MLISSIINLYQVATQDFWATLIAGLIGAAGAFGGVIFQRRSENIDRIAEEHRQRTEIAKALVCEINGFRDFYLIPVQNKLANLQAGLEHTITLSAPPSNAFPIYHANAHRIGEFNGEEVDALIQFYNIAESFAMTLVDGARARHNIEAMGDINRAQASARQIYGELREMIPVVLPVARAATDALAERIR